jgi:pimeloyl-ACP methyl ester carboxylesterase
VPETPILPLVERSSTPDRDLSALYSPSFIAWYPSAMRSLHCSVLLLSIAAFPSLAGSQAPAQPSGQVSTFKVFAGGRQVGTERVSVTESATGTIISGTGNLAPPADITTNLCEVRYDADWHPTSVAVDSLIGGVFVTRRVRFNNGTAVLQSDEGGRQSSRTDTVRPNNAVLVNSFFGTYEVLGLRLRKLQAGAEVGVYLVPLGEATVRIDDVSEQRVETPEKTISASCYKLSLVNAGKATSAELWADESGRMMRLAIPAAQMEIVREDVSTPASRVQVEPRAGDESVRIPANGFTIVGTLSRPAAQGESRVRYPAVVLVGGAGPEDREGVAGGVPIFADISRALAEAGFVVLRYDKRGVGQSGGRSDNADMREYADDVQAVVRYVRRRKDVDSKRIALVGYAEGGWVAMLAARGNKQVSDLVLLETPGVPGRDLVMQQQQHELDRMNLTPAERQAKVDLQKAINEAVITGTGWEKLPASVKSQADTYWYQSFLSFDPAKVMPGIHQPILIVQGDLDQEVFKGQAERLAELARLRKPPANTAVAVVHAPQVNHLLAAARTGERDEYATLFSPAVSSEVLKPMVSWLQAALAPRR